MFTLTAICLPSLNYSMKKEEEEEEEEEKEKK